MVCEDQDIGQELITKDVVIPLEAGILVLQRCLGNGTRGKVEASEKLEVQRFGDFETMLVLSV